MSVLIANEFTMANTIEISTDIQSTGSKHGADAILLSSEVSATEKFDQWAKFRSVGLQASPPFSAWENSGLRLGRSGAWP
jgi:hypothetical protein